MQLLDKAEALKSKFAAFGKTITQDLSSGLASAEPASRQVFDKMIQGVADVTKAINNENSSRLADDRRATNQRIGELPRLDTPQRRERDERDSAVLSERYRLVDAAGRQLLGLGQDRNLPRQKRDEFELSDQPLRAAKALDATKRTRGTSKAVPTNDEENNSDGRPIRGLAALPSDTIAIKEYERIEHLQERALQASKQEYDLHGDKKIRKLSTRDATDLDKYGSAQALTTKTFAGQPTGPGEALVEAKAEEPRVSEEMTKLHRKMLNQDDAAISTTQFISPITEKIGQGKVERSGLVAGNRLKEAANAAGDAQNLLDQAATEAIASIQQLTAVSTKNWKDLKDEINRSAARMSMGIPH